jgi:ribosomal protein S18 acetylase RimI-like enzyme
LIQFRPYLNTDAPLIAEIWRSQPPVRAVASLLTPHLFEQLILSKPYFDRLGFLVATDSGRPIGFVHAGFGINESQTALDYSHGIVCMLMTKPHEQADRIRSEMLVAAENYLKGRGAKTLMAVGCHPHNPFYLGLYGGGRLPGVLTEQSELIELFQKHNYRTVQQRIIIQRMLTDFRPVVDRTQLQLKRNYELDSDFDPPLESWWQACSLNHAERTRFRLIEKRTRAVLGEVTYWNIEPLSRGWGVNAAGLHDLVIRPEFRRQGLATMLVGESLKQLQLRGISLAEIQTSVDDQATGKLVAKLGFRQVGSGVVLSKSVDPVS